MSRIYYGTQLFAAKAAPTVGRASNPSHDSPALGVLIEFTCFLQSHALLAPILPYRPNNGPIFALVSSRHVPDLVPKARPERFFIIQILIPGKFSQDIFQYES